MHKQVRTHTQVSARSRKGCHANESLMNEPNAQQEKKKKKTKKKNRKITSFGQPTSLIVGGRASATLPHGIHLRQSNCQ